MQIELLKSDSRKKFVAIVTGWTILFSLCIVAYWPGLPGPFLLDDFGSIGPLGNNGGVTDWATFKAFVFGGRSGPSGRPLALLSFLIDGRDWPTAAWPFKRTNLIIHLINGALLGGLIYKILKLLEFESRRAQWIALISAACWMLHPFLVSTTLYAVQRMAQLSTLFVFAGLITYVYYRSRIAGNAKKAYIGMSLATGVFTILALLCKENGILLPLLIGVVEITVVASQQHRLKSLNRYWTALFLVLPNIVIALYLGKIVFAENVFDAATRRDYSLYERLLTQPRVLADYLRHWFVPELYTTGVFQDHFVKSTALLSPITTFLSILLHVGVVTVSFIQRRRWPLIALAALFFYVSHTLESSVVNLELYFEHRNYLAAAFLFLPFVVMLQKKASRQVFVIATLVVVLLFAGFTRYTADIWSSFSGIVEASARKAPTSARAQAQYSKLLFNEQRYDESLAVIDRAIASNPYDRPLLLINRITMLCNLRTITQSDFDNVAAVLSQRVYDPRLSTLYATLTFAIGEPRCPVVSNSELQELFLGMLEVPQNNKPRSLQYSQIKSFIGLNHVFLGEPSEAVASFEESLRFWPNAADAMVMANQLALRGFYDDALYLSKMALTLLDVELRTSGPRARVSEAEIREFQAAVTADRDNSSDDDSAPPAPK